MRRGQGKLSSLNWKLVLLAGIFQIISFVFDQVAIQYEEKNRDIKFKILSTSESRSAYLKMNNRLDYDLGVYFNIKNELNEICFNSLEHRLSNFPNTGVDILFPASKDYGYYWYFENNKFLPTSLEKITSLKRKKKFLVQSSLWTGLCIQSLLFKIW